MQNTREKMQNSRVETIFYLTLMVTVVQAGFILWDMAVMLPGMGRVLGLKEANTVQSSSLMSNIYLALLGLYASYKEFLRWTSGSDEVEVPEEQVKRFRRGEIIVSFWVVLAVLALSIWQMKLIARMPEELFRTALQSLGIMFGTYASKGLYTKKRGKKNSDVSKDADLEAKVMQYLKENGSITNEACQNLLQIGRGKAYWLLEKLEKEGKIRPEGSGKALKYVLTGK